MTLYVSRARRQRTTAGIAVVVGLLAFGLGLLLGRNQLPSVDHRVDEVRAAAGQVATGIERLDIEYQQVRDGGDSLEDSVLRPLAELSRTTQQTMDRAPWLEARQRSAVVDALAVTRQSAADADDLPTFRAHLIATAGLVRATFGIAG